MVADVYKALGRRLSLLRTARGLSLEDLAEALATSPERISGFETSAESMSVTDLVRLAGAMDVPLAALVVALEPGNVVRLPLPPPAADGHRLIAAFLKIRDAQARAFLLEMAASLVR